MVGYSHNEFKFNTFLHKKAYIKSKTKDIINVKPKTKNIINIINISKALHFSIENQFISFENKNELSIPQDIGNKVIGKIIDEITSIFKSREFT